MKFRDNALAMNVMETTISYYERLGVSIAILIGGGAMMKYASNLFPIFPALPLIVGLMTMLVALMLLPMIVGHAYMQLKIPENRTALHIVVVLSIMLNSTFFFLAGITVAAHQLA